MYKSIIHISRHAPEVQTPLKHAFFIYLLQNIRSGGKDKVLQSTVIYHRYDMSRDLLAIAI